MANKYAFNKSYYNKMAQNTAFNGNAARKLNVVEEEYYDDEEFEDEYVEEEYYEEIVNERPQRIERPEAYEQQVTREKSVYRVKVNNIMATLFVSALIVFVMSAFYYLNVKSQISETGKQIKKAEAKLVDVESLNASLRTALDTKVDRNYIYSVAVGKLGMVYPNDNQIVTYKATKTEYVRQMSTIPDTY